MAILGASYIGSIFGAPRWVVVLLAVIIIIIIPPFVSNLFGLRVSGGVHLLPRPAGGHDRGTRIERWRDPGASLCRAGWRPAQSPAAPPGIGGGLVAVYLVALVMADLDLAAVAVTVVKRMRARACGASEMIST